MWIHATPPARKARRLCAWLPTLLAAALLLSACGGSSSGDAAPPTGGSAPASKTFTYTLTDSGGNLLVGRRVAVLDAPVTGTCAGGTPGPAQHSVDAAVTTPGTVTLSFTLSFPGAYAESIYIDVDGSRTLTAGDLVWGTNPLGFASACIASLSVWAATQSLDWSAVAASGPGSIVYTGTAQAFAIPPQAAAGVALGDWFELPDGGY